MLRTRLLPLGLLAVVGLLAACENAPDYPKEPSIEFAGLQRIRVSHPRFGVNDSLVVTINWKDGDGDLGLSQADLAQPPYNTEPYSKNYIIQPYTLQQGRWEPVTFNNISYNGTFPRVQPEGGEKEEPLRGVLNYSGVKIPTGYLAPGTKMRFDVKIIDRALNESNTITTSEVTLP